jgi:hypothetical protein
MIFMPDPRDPPEKGGAPLIATAYTIYRPDGSRERGSVDWPKHPGRDLIKRLVEPIIDGPIEHVTVLAPGLDRRDMFVDELGHIGKPEPKPRNERATAIYRAAWVHANPADNPEELPWIAGTAVLFDRIVWF